VGREVRCLEMAHEQSSGEMRTTDQQRAARRLYLALRAHGCSTVHRPHPVKPGKRQIGIFGLALLPDRQRPALQAGVRALQAELMDLVLHVPGDPDGRAVLEEGSAG
jgi:hypothetical protein